MLSSIAYDCGFGPMLKTDELNLIWIYSKLCGPKDPLTQKKKNFRTLSSTIEKSSYSESIQFYKSREYHQENSEKLCNQYKLST